MPDRTILCYGDSNTHGTRPIERLGERRRYGAAERWTGVLRATLGAGWTVIEEGLPGRTTVHDDPVEGIHRNGLSTLQAIIESHRPIDVVVLMLGTNDLKARFALPPDDIAAGAGVLADRIRRSETGPDGMPPRVLLVAPPPLGKPGVLAGMFPGGLEKSRLLAPAYAAVAQRLGVAFLDAGTVIRTGDDDGVHFDPPEHAKLAEAVARSVRAMFAD